MGNDGKGPTFGVVLQGVDPPGLFLELVREIEELGFDQLWLTDSSLHARYVYAYLAIAANATKRLTLGTSVTNPLTRHPAMNALAIATIDEISGGRAVFGIGAGDRPIHSLGLAPAGLAMLRETVETSRRLLSGEEISACGNGVTMDGARLHFPSRPDIPIYVGASGPKTLELAGEIGDGVILLAGLFRKGIEYALSHIRAGNERGQRPAPDVAGFMYGSLRDDPSAAIEEARPIAAWFCQNAPRYCQLAGMDEEVCEAVRASYQGGEFQEALAASQKIPDEMVRKMALAGTAQDGREKVAMLVEAGVGSAVLFPLGADRRQVIGTFAREVMRHFK